MFLMEKSVIDSHAHLTSPELLPHVDALVARAKEAGVDQIINICTDRISLEEGLRLQERCPGVYNTAATTPHDVEKEGELFFPIVEAQCDKLVAIGETGLDYYYEHSPKKIQQRFLSRYFELAIKVGLPLIFHCREAFEDLFAMTDEQFSGRRALLHCFTGTIEEARKCLDRGWSISFSGIITFKKSEALREVVKFVPLDRLFIETDAPYLAPLRQRGKQNEPSFIIEIAEKIGELKEISLNQVISATTTSARQFFALN